ncbi:complement receptor type 2-like [Candoia aspera]|uniref:complement receptor type 2-like n=1 Tax=Candoia aspera TaxID=51853 RepID=UPI002FD82EB3
MYSCFFIVFDCEDPGVKHGIQINRTTDEYFHGDSATFICDTGYFLTGNYLIKCVKNNTWYPSVPFCRKSKNSLKAIIFLFSPILCGAPIIPTGGVEPLRPYYGMGSTIVAYCNRNYCFPDETIEMKAQCEGYNMWDPPVPPCFFRTISDTVQLHIYNGNIVHGKKDRYNPGDNITVECIDGYVLRGSSKIRYIGGKQWLPEIPTCSLSMYKICKHMLTLGILLYLCRK